jgi:hypothetical protein
MNKENIQKLVNALRSGEYPQAKGALKNEDGFCCLGVACDIYAKEHRLEWEKGNAKGFDSLLLETALPPSQVWLWLGGDNEFDYKNPSLEIPPHLQKKAQTCSKAHATTLNDNCDFTFEEIADCFEYTYLTPVAAEAQ